MKEGPNIALLGSLIGDPARANILTALMSGQALTASELAAEAGVTLPTASSHLAKLEAGKLIRRRTQGRHRYFSLADDEVGAVLEAMMGLAANRGHVRTRTGPKDPALRKARVCYDHLAGEFGVRMFESLQHRGHVRTRAEDLELTPSGRSHFAKMGIDIESAEKSRRPLCRPCLDWSARRTHLAGSIGSALLKFIYESGWARKRSNSRVVEFTPDGERRFLDLFPE